MQKLRKICSIKDCSVSGLMTFANTGNVQVINMKK